MAETTHRQVIELAYESTAAARDAERFAHAEQARTKQTGDVATRAAASVAAADAKVASAAKAAGEAGRKAGQDTAASMDAAKASAAGLGEAMAGLMTGSQVLGALTKAGALFTAAMTEAAEWTKRVAADFLATQQSMQGMAALTGKVNSDKFTTEQIQKAASVNLKPAEMTAFQDTFLSKASNYVGTGPSSKMSDAESSKFQASMAEYAKLHGVSMPEMADFAGSLLAQAKGPQTSQAGKVFATLEASSAKVGHLLPGMTRVMAQGFKPEEAAPILAQMPEIAPEEESTHLLRLVAEVRKLNLEGKAGAYGIKEGMSPAKQLETLIADLHAKSGGGKDAKGLDALIQGITKEDIAGNTLRGLVNQGPAGIKQWQDLLKKTPDDVVPVDIEKGRKSDAGRTLHAEAQLAAAEAGRGARFADVERLKKEAEAQLAKEGVFDKYHPVEDPARSVMSWFKGTSGRQQRINERAEDLASAGLPAGQLPRAPLSVGAHQLVANERIRLLLEKQTVIAERQLHLQEEEARRRVIPLPGPLSPPLPGPQQIVARP
jgi:hypothetical protein